MDYDSEKQNLEKELKCNDCNYTTRRKDSLKHHQEATHEGGKKFTSESEVTHHKKSIHLMHKFSCNLCGYKAKQH